MDPVGQEDGELAPVHPDGDAEPHRSPVALLHRLGDNCPHGVRGPAGPAGVSLAREQDEDRVARPI